MKSKHQLFIFSLVTTFLLSACKSETLQKLNDLNREVVVAANGNSTPTNNPTIQGSLSGGQTIAILPEAWMNYCNDLSDSQNVSKYYEVGVENTKPVSTTLSWSVVEEATYYLTYLSRDVGMSNPIITFSTEKSVLLSDLYAGTHYYYQIHAHYEDKTIISRRFDFNTVDFFRTLDIDGVQNARDLGNKITVDGSKKVKQGLVYRSANLDSVTEKGKIQATLQYGIKTDLDLRAQGPSGSPLGSSVNYVNNGYGTYGSPFYVSGNGIDNEDFKPVMKENLKTFTNTNNLPLVFHCAVGRDRTGTLAVLLYLLLGVELEQIKQDYYVYVFTSICNAEPITTMAPSFNNLLNYLTAYVGNDGVGSGTIYERAEEYCLDIGLTSSEISAIRENLLEETNNE